MVVILGLVFQRSFRGDYSGQRPSEYLGAELGAPADTDPSAAYAAARPEWSFRGLYQFAHLFSGSWQIIPIFVVPSLLMLYVFALPFIGIARPGHVVNVVVVLLLLVALVLLSGGSYRADANDPEYQTALADGERAAQRAVVLARGRGIPAAGALGLLRSDPKTQGPVLFALHCMACHTYSPSPAEGKRLGPKQPSAPELHGFASRTWLNAFLDPQQLKSDQFYGHTRFAAGIMVKYVDQHFAKLDENQRQAIVAALSAEAQLPSQAELDARGQELITKGREMLTGEGCTRCHRYHDQGAVGEAPELTGYGNRDWLAGIIAEPTHYRLYGTRNDRMPSYADAPQELARNRLSATQIDVLVSWLRGEWYEPTSTATAPAPSVPLGTSALLALGRWDARRGPRSTPAADTKSQALALLTTAQCTLCHDYANTQDAGVYSRQPSAPSLYGFASAEWLRGLLDPAQVAGPKYFGTNKEFKDGEMVKFVRNEIKGLIKDNGQENFDRLVAALAAEAQKDGPGEKIDEEIETLVDDFNCSNCHKFYGTGDLGSAPDLTGYGSRAWLTAFLINPEDERFYPDSNVGMPPYHAFPEQPQKNLLTKEQILILAELVRGRLEK
jgi:ubiquinol-cytochrome c reductase cytochrome b subunit